MRRYASGHELSIRPVVNLKARLAHHLLLIPLGSYRQYKFLYLVAAFDNDRHVVIGGNEYVVINVAPVRVLLPLYIHDQIAALQPGFLGSRAWGDGAYDRRLIRVRWGLLTIDW